MQPKVRSGQRGQALLETIMILPIAIFLVLGALQLMLIQHGRIMAQYAAFAAARAGIVHNGNWNVMRNAALVTSLPLYGRTDTFAHLLVSWLRIKPLAEATEAVDTAIATVEGVTSTLLGVDVRGITQDVSLVEVHVTSPGPRSFAASADWQRQAEEQARAVDPGGALRFPDGHREVDFDDRELMMARPETGRLAVEVRVLYPLRIPLLNRLIFELWLAHVLLQARRVEANLPEWMELRARVNGGQYLDEAVRTAPGEGPLDDFFTTSQWTREIRTLRALAERTGVYLVPLHGSYAMPMQSSAFRDNAREPVWFDVEDGS